MKKTTAKIFRIIFFIFTGLFSLGQLQRVELGNFGALYLHDLVIVGWLSLVLCTSSVRSLHIDTAERMHNWLKQKSLLKIAILLGVWILLGMAVNSVAAPSLQPWFYLGRSTAYLIFAVSVAVVFRQKTLGYWIIPGVIILYLGLLQYLLLPDIRFLWIFGWDDHFYRLAGTLFDPAFTGMVLVLCSAYILYSKFPKPLKFSKWLILFGLAAAILLTYSRSSYLAFSVLLGSLLTRSKMLRNKVFLVGLGLVLLTAVFWMAPKPGGLGVDLLRTATIQARIDNSITAIESMRGIDWLIGKGMWTPIQTSAESHNQIPDNLFVMILAATGIPGLALFLLILGKMTAELWRKDFIFFGAMLALLVHSQFNNTLLQPFVMIYFAGGLASLYLSGGIRGKT